MSKTKSSMLSGMIDSGSEDDFNAGQNMMPTPDTSVENVEPQKKRRGRPAGTANAKATKGTAKTSRKKTVKANSDVEAKASVPAKRKALREQSNERVVHEAEELQVDDDGERHEQSDADEEATSPARNTAKKIRGAQGSSRVAPSKSRPAQDLSVVEEQPSNLENERKQDSSFERQKGAPSKQQRPNAEKPREGRGDAGVEAAHTESTRAQPSMRPSSQARSISRSRPDSSTRNRGVSLSDTERHGGGGDPALRRKLGEMTRKFQSLDLKYRNLREVGIQEAENNFDRLKQQSERNLEGANKLIESLKSELAEYTKQDREAESLKRQLTAKEAEVAKLRGKVSNLNASLSENQNENKSLNAKLAASRSAQTSVSGQEPSKSHANLSRSISRNAPNGNFDAVQASQLAQLKEELYSDLTGLIIRNVVREDEGDTFDCIQTGRNGALHFKLAIAHLNANGKDRVAPSYEETEITFTPMLDSSRDGSLIELLPEYLTEEITFSREVASKFFNRVVDCLTKST